MAALALLEVGRPRDRRARLDERGGLQLAGAVLALVAAGAGIAAVRARADDVTVRQEPAVGGRVHLPGDPLLDVPLGVEPLGEVLGELVVGDARRPPEVVPRQPEPLTELTLDLVV